MERPEVDQTEEDDAVTQKKLEILRREIMIGWDDFANGRLSDRTVEEIAADVAKSDRQPTHPSTGSG